jgi:hypothetical protein
MMLLLLFNSYVPKLMVGTDLVNAVVLTDVRTGALGMSILPCSLAFDQLNTCRLDGF